MNEVQAINTNLNLLNQSLINRIETLQQERDAALQEVDNVTENLSFRIDNQAKTIRKLRERTQGLKDTVNRVSEYAAEKQEKLDKAYAQIAALSSALEEVTESVEQTPDEPEKEDTKLTRDEVEFMLAMLQGNASGVLASLMTKPSAQEDKPSGRYEYGYPFDALRGCQCPKCKKKREAEPGDIRLTV